MTYRRHLATLFAALLCLTASPGQAREVSLAVGRSLAPYVILPDAPILVHRLIQKIPGFSSPSCPDLIRASTLPPHKRLVPQYISRSSVDGRIKSGHDELGEALNPLSASVH
ncbi:MAG: hypothetical protein HYU60_00955 [Magnetospirillum sp.]|nr:hypothetical protein [Magnetospirillum sp.]